MIVGISGKMNSGKDSLAEMIREICPQFKIKKFAGKLKQISAILTGLEDQYSQEGKAVYMPEWGMTVGEFQQKLGTNAVRNGLHQYAWVIALFSDYRDGDNWIITDVRFPNEANAIKLRGGVLVRINRDCKDGSGRDSQHTSETSLDNYDQWDRVIDNNGSLSDLRKQAEALYTDIKECI